MACACLCFSTLINICPKTGSIYSHMAKENALNYSCSCWMITLRILFSTYLYMFDELEGA